MNDEIMKLLVAVKYGIILCGNNTLQNMHYANQPLYILHRKINDFVLKPNATIKSKSQFLSKVMQKILIINIIS